MINLLSYPRGISRFIPPPGFAPGNSITHLHISLFNLMTNRRGVPLFEEMISELDEVEILATFLTSDSDLFMAIVTNKYGSRCMGKLLGKSQNVDILFCAAILRHFVEIMTNKYAYFITIQAIIIFKNESKEVIYESILYHVLDLACNRYGSIALNDIIRNAYDPYYRDQILDLVAYNAVSLTNNASGNFVVKHVLSLHNLRCTYKIVASLRGHCIMLSFNKHGSYIVEKLLEKEESIEVVVMELLDCGEEMLMMLSTHEFGNFVVGKALKLTKEMFRIDLFWCLVQKLLPFLRFLRRMSHGRNIANILETYKLRC